jgi:hypothetical protein
MNDDQIAEQIAAHLGKNDRLSGVAEVYRTYTAAYERRSGGTVEVTVRILRDPDVAWKVHVQSEDGKVAASNFSSSLEAALSMVHWERLG